MKRLTRSVDPVESRSPVSDVHRSLWWLARLLLLNALSTSSEVKFTLYREADTDRSVAVKVVRVRPAEPSLNASPGRPRAVLTRVQLTSGREPSSNPPMDVG